MTSNFRQLSVDSTWLSHKILPVEPSEAHFTPSSHNQENTSFWFLFFRTYFMNYPNFYLPKKVKQLNSFKLEWFSLYYDRNFINLKWAYNNVSMYRKAKLHQLKKKKLEDLIWTFRALLIYSSCSPSYGIARVAWDRCSRPLACMLHTIPISSCSSIFLRFDVSLPCEFYKDSGMV